jgi:hypothetical protein
VAAQERLGFRTAGAISGRQALRPQRTDSDRLLLAALSRVLPRPWWQTFLEYEAAQ